MAEKVINPPLTDRGVEDTCVLINQEKNILIDWFQCTLKIGANARAVLRDYFNVSDDDIKFEEGGLFSYDRTFYFNNIKVMESSKHNNLGTHIYLTGAGCRDVENLGLDWYILFNRLYTEFDLNITRIDIAIDTFSDKYFTLDTIRDYISNGQILSRFKSSTSFIQQSLAVPVIESETIWFGSRVSNIQIVFYNKLMERKNASYKVRPDIKHWYRVETRFRNEVAYSFVQKMLSSGIALPSLINDVLYYYLDFKDYSTDSNKSRSNTSQWWLDFLDTNNKLSLDINIKESSLVSKKVWLENTVSKTEFMVYVSDIVKDDFTVDLMSSGYIYNQLKQGYSRLLLSDKDISKINDYRLNKGMLPLTRDDLFEIINSVEKLLL